MKRILEILHIDPSEEKLVSLSFLMSLFLGAAYSFTAAVPLAIFLGRFQSQLLPYLYMSTALVALAIGGAFSFLQKRVSFHLAISSMLVFLIAMTTLFWALFYSTPFAWLPIAFLIWGFALETFIVLIFGILGNRLFTLQQGKRLLGILAAGLSIGGILAGLALPGLVYWIGTQNTILMISGCLAIALVLFFCFKGAFSFRLEKGEEDLAVFESAAKISYKEAVKKRYILFIFLLLGITTLEYFSLDLIFNKEIQKYYLDNEAAMASFLGVFFAASDVLNLIFSGILLRIILEKFGVIAAIALMPLTAAPLFLLAFLASWFPDTTLIVFGIIVLSRLFLEIFEITIIEDSYFLLYQPLKPVFRSWVQIQGEMVINPIATVVAGLILLGTDAIWGLNLGTFTCLILIFSAAHLLLLPIIKKGYLKELLHALSKRVLIGHHSKQTVTQEEKLEARKRLLSEKQHFQNLRQIILRMPENILRNFLLRELEISQECLFSLLSIIYSEDPILIIQEKIMTRDEDLTGYGTEALIHLLSSKDKELIPLLSLNPYEEPISSTQSEAPLLLEVFHYASSCTLKEIPSVVIYVIGVLKLKELLNFVQEQADQSDPLLEETKKWTLSQFF